LATADGSSEKRLREFSCNVLGDLAYYCAESFSLTPNPKDQAEALENLRRLTKDWTVFGEPPISMVDNYLFVVSKIPTATADEQEIGRKMLINRAEELREHLTANERQSLFADYEKFFGVTPTSPDGRHG
jgi:hypothetical protein